MPGMGLLIDGAMQHAAQRGRQFMSCYIKKSCSRWWF
jgi:hypothetical protein